MGSWAGWGREYNDTVGTGQARVGGAIAFLRHITRRVAPGAGAVFNN